MNELRELHSDLFAYINQLSQLAAGKTIREQNRYLSEASEACRAAGLDGLATGYCSLLLDRTDLSDSLRI